jgi:hypothetical protein
MRGHIGVPSFVVSLLIEEFIKEPTYSGRGGGTAGIVGEVGIALRCDKASPTDAVPVRLFPPKLEPCLAPIRRPPITPKPIHDPERSSTSSTSLK